MVQGKRISFPLFTVCVLFFVCSSFYLSLSALRVNTNTREVVNGPPVCVTRLTTHGRGALIQQRINCAQAHLAMVTHADVQSLAEHLRSVLNQLNQRITMDALGAAFNQIRSELLVVINIRTDQLNGTAIAPQQVSERTKVATRPCKVGDPMSNGWDRNIEKGEFRNYTAALHFLMQASEEGEQMLVLGEGTGSTTTVCRWTAPRRYSGIPRQHSNGSST